MITKRLNIVPGSFVVELASNDGYLLKNFLRKGIDCLGVEPTDSTAAVAESLGIRVIREFFCEDLGHAIAAREGKADLICGNNVYAHVPDINDFTRGIAALLKSEGVVTLEFPHLLKLIEACQFDTVYHEHFSYLSLGTVRKIFSKNGLRVFDVEELSTHGGSLRVYGCLANSTRQEMDSVPRIQKNETDFGLDQELVYSGFQERADKIKDDFLEFLIQAKRDRKKVVGYGAAAKGNTLLNYAGVKKDLIAYVCDAADAKQGKYLPGVHIPILPPSSLKDDRPDYVVIFPWNIAAEITDQLAYLRAYGTKFVIAVPSIKVF